MKPVPRSVNLALAGLFKHPLKSVNHAHKDCANRRDEGHDRGRETQPSDPRPAANACSIRARPSSNAWRTAAAFMRAASSSSNAVLF